MAKKGIEQLVPDLKNALALSTKNVAHKVTIGLKEVGPYWTGQFESAWEVQVGQNGIPASLKDQTTYDKYGTIEYQGKKYPEPGDKVVTEPFVPEPNKLNGYTIGNLMEYREEAMDLKPGVRTDNAANLTAREDWFVSYVKGGEMQADIAKAVKQVMRVEGF